MCPYIVVSLFIFVCSSGLFQFAYLLFLFSFVFVSCKNVRETVNTYGDNNEVVVQYVYPYTY